MGIITVNTDPYKLWGDDWKPETEKNYTLYVDKFISEEEYYEEDPQAQDYFGYRNRANYIEAEVAACGTSDEDNFNPSKYKYDGDTLEYDGDTYYLCDSLSDENPCKLLLSTDDYETLLSESIAESGNDTQFTSLSYIFVNDDNIYDNSGLGARQLLKIIQNEV